jgi:hypothetical protein
MSVALEVADAGPLVQIRAPERHSVIILTHPLWRGLDAMAHWTEEQNLAHEAARSQTGGDADIDFMSLWELRGRPEIAFRRLVAPNAI